MLRWLHLVFLEKTLTVFDRERHAKIFSILEIEDIDLEDFEFEKQPFLYWIMYWSSYMQAYLLTKLIGSMIYLCHKNTEGKKKNYGNA